MKKMCILSAVLLCSLLPWTGRSVSAESVSAPVLQEAPDVEAVQELQEEMMDEGVIQEIQQEVSDGEEKVGISGNELPETDGIPIDEEHFPDSDFRKYLTTYLFDKDKDGILSEQEIKEMDSIYCPYESAKGWGKIKSLEGIEYFTEITSLECSDNDLTSLDVSQNKKLRYLDCNGNRLETLIVGDKADLNELYCSANHLEKLDLTGVSGLERLQCSANRLKSLQIKDQGWMEVLDCADNRLSHLNLSGIRFIYYLYCYKNNLISLRSCDVNELYCYDNVLTELDLSNSPSAWCVYCNENMLRTLDLSNNFLMKNKPPEDDAAYDKAILKCSHNRLESIKFAKDNDLGILYCEDNRLSSLDVEALQGLHVLECHDNRFSTFDVTKMTGLGVFHPDPETKVTYADTPRLVSLTRDQKEAKITWDYDGRSCSGFSIYRKVGKGGWKKAGEIRKGYGKGRYSYTDKYTGKGNVTYTVAAFRSLRLEDSLECERKDHQGPYDSKGLSAAGVPSAPKNIRAAAGSGRVKLTWKKVSGSSGYHIYRKASKNAKWAKIADVKAGKVSYIDKKVKWGRTYSYRVRAYRKGTGKDKNVVVNGVFSAVKKASIR